MHQVPKDVDWSFMFGKDLIQVCYGKYQTQLIFDGNLCISIEAGIVHCRRGKVIGKSSGREQGITSLIGLLGASIEDVQLAGEDMLVLAFTNSDVLRVLKHEDPYESFSISAPGQLTIIA